MIPVSEAASCPTNKAGLKVNEPQTVWTVGQIMSVRVARTSGDESRSVIAREVVGGTP